MNELFTEKTDQVLGSLRMVEGGQDVWEVISAGAMPCAIIGALIGAWIGNARSPYNKIESKEHVNYVGKWALGGALTGIAVETLFVLAVASGN